MKLQSHLVLKNKRVTAINIISPKFGKFLAVFSIVLVSTACSSNAPNMASVTQNAYPVGSTVNTNNFSEPSLSEGDSTLNKAQTENIYQQEQFAQVPSDEFTVKGWGAVVKGVNQACNTFIRGAVCTAGLQYAYESQKTNLQNTANWAYANSVFGRMEYERSIAYTKNCSPSSKYWDRGAKRCLPYPNTTLGRPR